jgi:hypothetical protein
MSKYYEVRFYTKKGGEQSWIIHVEAKTAKEAKEIAIHATALQDCSEQHLWR